jgi:recombination protein RecR
MRVLPRSVEKVIEEFERLPGVGPKSAARMAYFFLRAPKDRSIVLAEALIEMKENIVTCSKCFNVSDSDPCRICDDGDREQDCICVVEEPLDVVALERSGVYSGKYFVLGGVISPADGVGPEQLRMRELKGRVQDWIEEDEDEGTETKRSTEAEESIEKTLEVIVATNPSLEGEATASFIVDLINRVKKNGIEVKITRLAMGLPTGADLEYADRLTLKRSVEGRTRINSKK